VSEQSGAPKSVKFPELQEKLFKYYVEKQNNGNDVSKKNATVMSV
jgi:hypothetical protein